MIHRWRNQPYVGEETCLRELLRVFNDINHVKSSARWAAHSKNYSVLNILSENENKCSFGSKAFQTSIEIIIYLFLYNPLIQLLILIDLP